MFRNFSKLFTNNAPRFLSTSSATLPKVAIRATAAAFATTALGSNQRKTLANQGPTLFKSKTPFSEREQEANRLMVSSNPADLARAQELWQKNSIGRESLAANQEGVALLMRAIEEQTWEPQRDASKKFLEAYRLDPSNDAAIRNFITAWYLTPTAVFTEKHLQTKLQPQPEQSTDASHTVLNSLDKSSPENKDMIEALEKLDNDPDFIADFPIYADTSPRPLTRSCG